MSYQNGFVSLSPTIYYTLFILRLVSSISFIYITFTKLKKLKKSNRNNKGYLMRIWTFNFLLSVIYFLYSLIPINRYDQLSTKARGITVFLNPLWLIFYMLFNTSLVHNIYIVDKSIKCLKQVKLTPIKITLFYSLVIISYFFCLPKCFLSFFKYLFTEMVNNNKPNQPLLPNMNTNPSY